MLIDYGKKALGHVRPPSVPAGAISVRRDFHIAPNLISESFRVFFQAGKLVNSSMQVKDMQRMPAGQCRKSSVLIKCIMNFT